jgi:hypothetical protein
LEADCGQGCLVFRAGHTIAANARAVARGESSAGPLQCPVQTSAKGLSKLALSFFPIIREIAKARSSRLVCEAWVVPGVRRGWDFWLVECNVLVEVDGRQHDSSAHHGKPAEEQASRDRANDAKAVADGRFVVRLHCGDIRRWHRVLLCALDTLQCNPQHPCCVFFSPAYRKALEGRTLYVLAAV